MQCNTPPMLPYKVLIADSNAYHLDLMSRYLKQEGMQVTKVTNGVEACKVLTEVVGFNLIIAEAVMPIIGGIELARILQRMPNLSQVPVIIQTGATASAKMVEGLAAGALYYICKPYSRELFLAHVYSALRLGNRNKQVLNIGANQLGNMSSGSFNFSSMFEADNIIEVMMKLHPASQKLGVGLKEIMYNAVEHGNLGLGFAFKKELLASGQYHSELEQRLLAAPGLLATLEFKRTAEGLHITVADAGAGFDWRQYLDFSPDRLEAPNGRGIAIASKFGFDSLEYIEPGNQVICRLAYTHYES